MQLQRLGTQREDVKTFDIYVYCDDDGQAVYTEER